MPKSLLYVNLLIYKVHANINTQGGRSYGWKSRYNERFDDKQCRGGATLQGLISKVFGYINRFYTINKGPFICVDYLNNINYNFAMKMNSLRKRAFTLAEVLITLGIIGVVAALTIPNLLVSYEKKQTVSRLQKVYSVLNQAYLFAKADGGDNILAENIIGDYDNTANRSYVVNFMSKYFVPHLRINKNCDYTSDEACFGKSYKRYFGNGNEASSGITYYKYNIILNDGAFISVTTNNICDADGNNCVSGGGLVFYIDINGAAKPNTFGKDNFIIYITPNSSNIEFYQNGNTRTALLNDCNSMTGFRRSCGALIKRDGWKISADYLW